MLSEQPNILFEAVPASVTNMSLFDRLTDSGIVRNNGVITKCMEDYIDGFQVCQKLYAILVINGLHARVLCQVLHSAGWHYPDGQFTVLL